MTDKYPATANIRGTIEFDTPARCPDQRAWHPRSPRAYIHYATGTSEVARFGTLFEFESMAGQPCSTSVATSKDLSEDCGLTTSRVAASFGNSLARFRLG